MPDARLTDLEFHWLDTISRCRPKNRTESRSVVMTEMAAPEWTLILQDIIDAGYVRIRKDSKTGLTFHIITDKGNKKWVDELHARDMWREMMREPS